MFDLQKADVWKRISALLFDLIMLVIVAIGAAVVLSAVFDYDGQSAKLEKVQETYEAKYGVDFDLSAEDRAALSEEELETFHQAYTEFSQDAEAGRLYSLLVNLSLLIVTFAALIAYLLLEFFVPLLFGHGRTLGKKVFGLAVMREDGVRLSPVLLFVRTVLGKYTVETMIPVMIIFMLLFNAVGIVGIVVLLLIGLLQIIAICVTRGRMPIHDLLAHTIAVDYASQRIFDSPEEMLAYKKKIHEEMASKAGY